MPTHTEMTQRHITSENQNICYHFKSVQSSVHRKNKNHVWMLKVSRTSFDLRFDSSAILTSFTTLGTSSFYNKLVLCFCLLPFQNSSLKLWNSTTALPPPHHRNLTLDHLEFRSHCFKILINTLKA